MSNSLPMRTSIFLLLGILLVFISVFTIFFVNSNMRAQAVSEAHSKARLLLDSNLATHTYFTKVLKPTLFKTLEPIMTPNYFDPSWMSSTFAVGKMQDYFKHFTNEPYEYKEASIDARSPNNEADDFEKAFLGDLQKNANLIENGSIRLIDGKPYLTVLRRGEQMEPSCLKCHSTPEEAPGDLVTRYRPVKSFNRQIDEVVQAVSIRIPLLAAYGNADYFSLKLSVLLLVAFIATFSVLFIFLKLVFVAPIDSIRNKASMIADNPELIGDKIEIPRVKELAQLVDAFNKMSLNLRKSHENLEEKVMLRTAELLKSRELLQHEIIERKKAEELLRESESTLSTLLNTAPVGVGLVKDRIFSWTNNSLSQMTGYSNEELRGRNTNVLYADEEEYIRVGNLIYDDIRKTGRGQIQTLFKTKNDIIIDIILEASAINSSSLSDGVVFTAMDITDRKRAEQEKMEMQRQLFHSQKLESLGILSGGIAHDFNNLLTVVIGNLELALYEIQYDSEPRTLIENALKASKKAADLSTQMLAYSGRGFLEISDVNINTVIVQNTEILRSAIPKTINLELDLNVSTPTVKADSAQIQQIVMNLLTNAAEALHGKAGTIRLTTGSRYCDSKMLSKNLLPHKPQPQKMVFIRVSDDGSGMDSATVERMFDPFFTTKFTGRGLGMSVVHGIVRGHEGAITVESQLDHGTTITVYLPISSEASDGLVSEEQSDFSESVNSNFDGHLNYSVLVVDDETDVNQLMKRILKRLGFASISAYDGKQALQIFSENPDSFNLIIVDLTMPEMDGIETLKKLRNIKPSIKVILCSGYDENEIKSKLDQTELPDAFLKKPFNYDTSTSLIRKLLQSDTL
ncbi:MAG: DUF3365 domain-containing protein [Desulfomonilaceae bacterium]